MYQWAAELFWAINYETQCPGSTLKGGTAAILKDGLKHFSWKWTTFLRKFYDILRLLPLYFLKNMLRNTFIVWTNQRNEYLGTSAMLHTRPHSWFSNHAIFTHNYFTSQFSTKYFDYS
jgi:hypothetical protein